jgi:hypothetical protein
MSVGCYQGWSGIEFRVLLAHPQKAINKRQLIYCVRVMSVGCYQGWGGIEFRVLLTHPQEVLHKLHLVY